MTQQRPSDTRPSVPQDQAFQRVLTERRADAQRDADRLQSEIDALLEQVDSKRREQAEHLNVVDACDRGLDVRARASRPTPQLAPHVNGSILTEDEQNRFGGLIAADESSGVPE